MTSAESVFNPSSDSLVRKANWLGRYLEVEKRYDRKLRVVLNDALKDIDSVMDRVGDDFSGQVRRTQLRLAQKAIRRNLDTVFSKTGNLIRDSRADAAVAAVDATLFDQKSIIATLFPDPTNRRNYADSLRQTAQRNIESVVTRVLFTEQPLSRRVYKTKALANGLVNKAINRGLSRGDSAVDIARSVRGLISPATPGGISYAAMRLGRTEINNAFHAQSIHDAQEFPWINQMRWHLSKVHESDPGDPCEFYSLTGLFDIEHVPAKPHPNCRCYVTPESALPDHDAFIEDVIQGRYDNYLDEVMARGGVDFSGNIKDSAKDFVLTDQQVANMNQAFAGFNEELGQNIMKTQRIQQELADRYGARTSFYGMSGDRFVVDPKAAEELSSSYKELADKYFHATPKRVGFGDVEGAYGETGAIGQRRFGGWDSRITLSDFFSQDYDTWKAAIADNEASGFHAPGSSDNPVRHTFFHEFGHSMANSVLGDSEFDPHGGITRDQIYEALNQRYMELKPQGGFVNWVKNGLTDYSFVDPKVGLIDPTESIAEAFDECERLGDKATEPAKVIYRLLIDKYNSRFG